MFHWSFVPLLIGIIAAGVGYVAAWRSLRGRLSPGDATLVRLVLFMTGLAVLAATLGGPLDWAAERRLMSLHMVQHILLISAVPALLFAGLPPAMMQRLSGRITRLNGSIAGAWACLLAGIGLIWALHVPAVLNLGLRSLPVNDLQHLVLLAAGALLVWPLVGGGALRGLPAAAYLVVTEIGIGLLGMWLAWYPNVVYSYYESVPRMWGLSPETDQSLAGALLLVVEEPFLAAEFAVVFIAALSDDDDDQEEEGEWIAAGE